MADAYRFASGEGQSLEYEALSYIDRFGADAVYGRTLSVRELKRMAVADNVISAYRARRQAQDWAAWSNVNKGAARLLNEAMKAAADDE